MRILITGLTGFIGGQLAPKLLDRGHELVALVRDPSRVPPHLAGQIELVTGDALDPDRVGLSRAMQGCDAFVWLLHSMEPDATGVDFRALELLSIDNAITAAQAAGVTRGVYLGGIAPSEDPSPHLGSRLAVETRLLDALPESTALRASIVIGAHSRSFRFLVRLVERMPALPLPAWRDNKTQPADQRDIIEALVRSVEGNARGQSLDIASPEVVTYRALIELIADRMLLPRPTVGLPFSLTAIAGPVAAAVAGEQRELIAPLMGSLGVDLLPRADGLAALGIRPHSLVSSVDRALGDWEAEEELAGR